MHTHTHTHEHTHTVPIIYRSLWKRFFELKEQEEQEQQERIVELLEEIYQINTSTTQHGRGTGPVESEQAIRARREMVCDYYRGLREGGENSSSLSSSSSSSTDYVRSNSSMSNGISDNNSRGDGGWNGETREANLDIPVGNFHVALPQ